MTLRQNHARAIPSDERPPREAILVVNAKSRRGAALFEQARAKLEAGGTHITAAHAVRDPSQLGDTVRRAVQSGTPMVIVGGGDGSLSGVVDDLVGHDCVFAVLPMGTANSFARSLGLPLDLDGAVAAITGGSTRRARLPRSRKWRRSVQPNPAVSQGGKRQLILAHGASCRAWRPRCNRPSSSRLLAKWSRVPSPLGGEDVRP